MQNQSYGSIDRYIYEQLVFKVNLKYKTKLIEQIIFFCMVSKQTSEFHELLVLLLIANLRLCSMPLKDCHMTVSL